MRPIRSGAVALMLLLMLTACVSTPQSALLREQGAGDLPVMAMVDDLAFFPQQAYQCGPAALATVLSESHVNVTPEQLVPLVYVPARRGSFQVEMVAAARSHGRLAYRLSPSLEALFSEISGGHPVLVMQNLALDWYPQWHFAVVKGYDLEHRRVILNSGLHEDHVMTLRTFERTWERAGHWAVVVLQPGEVPETAEPGAYFEAVVALESALAGTHVVEAYQAGLSRWPQDRSLRMGYGNLLYGEGDLNSAVLEYRSVIEHHPDYAPGHNNLAQALLDLGEVETAAQHARRALELGGTHVETYRATLNAIRAARR